MHYLVTFLVSASFLFSVNTIEGASFPNLFKKTEQHKYVVYNASPDVGFGAVIISLIAFLDEYDRGLYAGLKVDMDSGCFLDPDVGPNWWEYYFEPIDFGNANAPKHIADQGKIMAMYRIGTRISQARASELLERYVHLQSSMQEELDKFVETHFKDHYVIGVHHRGTDKETEIATAPYSVTRKTLEKNMAKLSKEDRSRLRIFVATDDQGFLDYIRKAYPNLVVSADFIRSADGKPLHYSKDKYGSNYQKGREAILDCLLLSKCDFLIYPAGSSFSHASRMFNQDLCSDGIKPEIIWRLKELWNDEKYSN